MRRSAERRLAAGGAVAVALLALSLNRAAGRRGFFAFDQSILFDAGHRLLSGQVPYADVLLPFGPVAPWLQASAFALGGVDFATYLWTACLENAAAALLAFALVRILVPRRPLLAITAGALTAVCFYPPSGTPWFDQTAFLAVLGSGVLLARPAATDGSRPGLGRPAASGGLWVAAVLSKQNAGLFALPLFALLAAVPALATPGREGWRRSVRLTGGWLLGAATASGAFFTWLAVATGRAGMEAFFEYAVRIPMTEGANRLASLPAMLFGFRPQGVGVPEFRWVLAATTLLCVLAAAGGAPRNRLGHTGAARRPVAIGATAAGLFTAQHLFVSTSFNQPEIAAPFTGIIPVLAAGALLAPWRQDLRRRGWRGHRGIRAAAAIASVAVGLLLGFQLLRASLFRCPHDQLHGVRFDRPVEVESLRPLLWGRPSRLEAPSIGTPGGRQPPGDAPSTIRADQLEALLRTIRERPGGLFVFPDWTILYGLTGRPAPQPLLWFHEGVTYPRGGSAALDARIVAALEHDAPETAVLEVRSWRGTGERLADFPLLARHLRRCFAPAERIGIFQVLERRAERCG